MLKYFAAVVVFSALPLAACLADQPDPSDPSGRTPSQLAEQRASCEAAGGEWTVVGFMGMGCVLPTSDGGKACTRSSDCESLCIANETGPGGTCLPHSLTGGCYALLNDDGEREDICVD